MAIVKYTLDPNKPLTEEQIERLKALKDRPITYDEENPPLTEEQLSKFRLASELNRERRNKQTVTIRLSPSALEKAKSLGKGYTSVLSRMLEIALQDNEFIERCL